MGPNQKLSRFEDLLRKEVSKRTKDNRDLITEKNRLQEQTFDLPNQLRAEFDSSSVRNPLDVERIVSGRRATTGSRLGTVTDLLNARDQSAESIITNALRGYQAELSDEEARRARAGSGGGYGGWGVDGGGGGGGGGTTTERIPVDPQEQRVLALMNEKGYSREEAENELANADAYGRGSSNTAQRLARNFLLTPGFGGAGSLVKPISRLLLKNKGLNNKTTRKLGRTRLAKLLYKNF